LLSFKWISELNPARQQNTGLTATATISLNKTVHLSASQTATKRIKTRSNTKSCYLLGGRINWQGREGRVLPQDTVRIASAQNSTLIVAYKCKLSEL